MEWQRWADAKPFQFKIQPYVESLAYVHAFLSPAVPTTT